MKNQTQVMVDLETLGVGYRPVITSIGACTFTIEDGLGRYTFQRTICIKSAQEIGLNIEAGTLQWWLKQSSEARTELAGKTDIEEALRDFAQWYDDVGTPPIWSNGSNFDLRILREVYEVLGYRCPFSFRSERDMRTFGALFPAKKLAREGTHHNALDDALHQSRVMVASVAE